MRKAKSSLLQFVNRHLRDWSPLHAIFEAAVAAMFSLLLKAFTTLSFTAAIVIGIVTFVAVASGFAIVRKKPDRSFAGFCERLADEAPIVYDVEHARQWALNVWTALAATNNSKAVEWSALMAPILKEISGPEMEGLVQRGEVWLRAIAVSAEMVLTANLGSAGGAKRVLYKMYSGAISAAGEVKSKEEAKSWALRTSEILRASNQLGSLDSFATIIRPLLDDEQEGLEFRVIVDRATAVITTVSAYCAPDEEQEGEH